MFRKINCLCVGIMLGIACQFGGLHAAEANGPHWIWYPAYRPLPNSFVFFRKELTVDSAIVSAKGRIAADSRYRLYVNGKLIHAVRLRLIRDSRNSIRWTWPPT